MRRLYWQVYLSFLAILLLFGVLLSVAFFATSSRDHRGIEALESLAEAALPAAGVPAVELSAVLDRFRETLGLSLAVWEDGVEAAAAGEALPQPGREWTESRVIAGRRAGFTVALRLSDGRWLVARHHRVAHRSAGGLAFLLLTGVAVALGAYPLVRRLTGRLERLQRQVDALGAGELGARVDVEGRDEVAELARTFNHTAERIERLVESQRILLAGVSHELRSPLARIRVATELLEEGAPSSGRALRERIEADISMLDNLIGELLFVARLDTLEAVDRGVAVDLLALAATVATDFDAEVTGEIAVVVGEEQLLKRLIWNLLSNAARHAGGKPAEVHVAPAASGTVVLSVADRGPGIPDEERETIFEPFYRLRDADGDRGNGVGLGLAIVRRIAQHLGGEVRCLARPGGGSRFEVTLPMNPSS